MIGVDTNVLLRLYVADDRDQHQAAVTFFEARTDEDPAFVRLIVFVEFIWALRKTYGYSNAAIAALVTQLLNTRDVQLEHHDLVANAVVHAEKEEGVGLTDALIALANRKDGCSTTMTFDRAAARRLPAMELLS